MFGRETFIVRVAEDAMAPRVRAGDYVWVDPDEPAADGRLVAVRVGALRRPVPEARAKPVRDGVDAESTQQAGHRGVVEHPPGGRGEHEPLSVEELRRAVEHLERSGRQRHPVRAAGIVHTAPSRSTCSHRAFRTSPERAAVSPRNSNASMVPRQAPEPFTR